MGPVQVFGAHSEPASSPYPRPTNGPARASVHTRRGSIFRLITPSSAGLCPRGTRFHELGWHPLCPDSELGAQGRGEAPGRPRRGHRDWPPASPCPAGHAVPDLGLTFPLQRTRFLPAARARANE